MASSRRASPRADAARRRRVKETLPSGAGQVPPRRRPPSCARVCRAAAAAARLRQSLAEAGSGENLPLPRADRDTRRLANRISTRTSDATWLFSMQRLRMRLRMVAHHVGSSLANPPRRVSVATDSRDVATDNDFCLFCALLSGRGDPAPCSASVACHRRGHTSTHSDETPDQRPRPESQVAPRATPRPGEPHQGGGCCLRGGTGDARPRARCGVRLFREDR